MKNLKKILAAALALCMLFCFVGCGDTETSSTADDTAKATAKVKVIDINLTEEEYAFGVDKDQPELLTKVNEFVKKIQDDGTFDEICDKYFGDGEKTPVKSATEDASKEQLVVATNAQFEPFEYKVGENFYGIDMEIAKLLADYLGKELVIKDMEFDAVCLSVGQHKCDIAMAGLTVNEKREEHVTFSTSYYTANQKLIVKGDDTTFDACKTTEDVEKILKSLDKTTKIGYQNGTTGSLYVQGDADWGFDGYDVEGKGYGSGSLAVQDLINGNIKYVVIDSDPATFIVEAINAVA
ncbi:MAG: transporter substrate-binding domain-containing protein [Clostridia bacterium]|nr:transporter substrate-binding domain-containing protein [Clostridia bacterium]